MLQDLYIGADYLVEYLGMTNTETGNIVNNASATWTLKDLDGNTLATDSLAYVADSDGTYRGTIAAAATGALTDAQHYTVTINVSSPAVDKRVIYFKAVSRGIT